MPRPRGRLRRAYDLVWAGKQYFNSLKAMAEEPQLGRTPKWEHDVFFWNDPMTRSGKRVDAALRAMLTAKGHEGWQLVAVTEGRPRTYTFFFTRPAED
jgi:hypothetical protein